MINNVKFVLVVERVYILQLNLETEGMESNEESALKEKLLNMQWNFRFLDEIFLAFSPVLSGNITMHRIQNSRIMPVKNCSVYVLD